MRRRVLKFFFPQIAQSYRGSYFSKVGLLITEIAAAPSLPSSFVSLHLSPCMLITEIAAAPSLPSSFVSLHADYRNLPLLAPFIFLPSFVSLHADSQNPCLFICLPSFVSLHADFQNPCLFSCLPSFPR